MTEQLSKIYKRQLGNPWQTIQQGTLILQPKLKRAHELDDVGSFIWSHLDGSKTVQELSNLIAEQFDVAEPDAEQDLIEFLHNLESEGLIQCL